MNYPATPIPQMPSDIPSELSGSLPRQLRLSENSIIFQTVIRILLVITIVAGSWYGEYVGKEIWQRSALRRDGVEIQGGIVQLNRASRGPYVVKYTFAILGTTFSGMTEVPPELVNKLEASNTITIKYLPAEPAINHPAAWEWSMSDEWLFIFMLLAFGWVVISNAVSFLRSRQVAANGIPVLGQVTECRTTGRGATKVKYKFCTPSGKQFAGRDYSKAQKENGSSIWIVYMPHDPRRNLVFPFVAFEVDQ